MNVGQIFRQIFVRRAIDDGMDAASRDDSTQTVTHADDSDDNGGILPRVQFLNLLHDLLWHFMRRGDDDLGGNIKLLQKIGDLPGEVDIGLGS